MTDGMILSIVCLGLLVYLLPFLVILAMLSRIRYMVTQIQKSLASPRNPKEKPVGDN